MQSNVVYEMRFDGGSCNVIAPYLGQKKHWFSGKRNGYIARLGEANPRRK